MRAAIYGAVSFADLGKTLETEQMPALRHYVAHRGWPAAVEFSDISPIAKGKRDGFDALCAAVAAGAIDVVVVEHLGRLFRDDRQTVKFGATWARAGIRLIATEQSFDATTPDGWMRLLLALELTAQGQEFRHRERQRCAIVRLQLAGMGDAIGGRPQKTVNPLELADLFYEGLSLREMALAMKRPGFSVSRQTLSTMIAALLKAGKLDEERRKAALLKRGGVRRGGRPAKPAPAE